MIKKTVAVLSALILAMSLMLTVVSAAPMVTLGQTTVPSAGDTFSVNVLLTENPGVNSIQILVTYDASSATLLYCGDGGYFDQFNTIPTDGGVILMWTSTAGNDNYSSGILATIVFTASDSPANGSLISATVLSATNTAGQNVTINGATSVLQFDTSAATDDDEVIADVEGDDDDEVVADDEDAVIPDDDDEVIIGEEDDIISADDDEEVTTATTKTTKATTTTKKKTQATTTTKVTTTTQSTTTSVTTTTEEVTTPATTTTEQTTPATTTTPEVTSTTPETSQSESVKFSGDAATAQAQKKMANGGTVFAAVMIVGVTAAAIVGMRVWKKEHK